MTDDLSGLFQILRSGVRGLDLCVFQLSRSFPPASLVEVHGSPVLRHREDDRNDLLLSFMKLVKIASHCNAVMILLEDGYAQEVNALCRMIDEAYEDIWFMVEPDGEGGKPSSQQQRFFNEFWQEEFSGPDTIKNHQRRDRVIRDKVRAGISRRADDPSGLVELGRAIAGTYSGYVHGAYVHVMELYGGEPPRYHTQGVAGLPILWESAEGFVNQVHRGLSVVDIVAGRAGRQDIQVQVLDVGIAFAKATECLKPEGIQVMEERLARLRGC